MLKIYKYVIGPVETGVLLPVGAEILTVAFQGELFCLWAKVDPTATSEIRDIYTFPTGVSIPEEDTYKYIGTGYDPYNRVLHAFERVRDRISPNFWNLQ